MPYLHLDRNENLYGPSPQCTRALREANLEQLSLYSRSYLRGTKSVLSDRLALDTGVPEKQILLSYGSEDLIKQTIHCYLDAGDTLLIPGHSWWYYRSVASEVNGIPITYPLLDTGDRFEYTPGAVTGLYDKHKPRVILIASPNNPTGHSIAGERLDEIARHCTESVIVVDQAYFGFSPLEHDTAAELLAAHPRILILRTFSKLFALAGSRIGYAFSGKGLERLTQFSQRYLGFNRISESLALAALDDSEYYRRIVHWMEEDRRAYYQLFSSMPGFTCYRSDANFVLVRYDRALRPALAEELRQREIVVKFLEDPGLDDCVRITIGRREDNLRVRDALGAFAQQVLNTSGATSPAIP
jgi:histidinol-phosphate aminotransferase